MPETQPSKSVLITGHSGFVGTNLVGALQDDFDLFGLDIIKKGALPNEKVWLWEQFKGLPGVDVVIHLAGKAHDTANASDPDDYFRVNLGLTKQIFDWFLDSDAQTFVFFSSVKAVADTVSDKVLDEEELPDPATPYGQSKLAAEEYILKAWKHAPGKKIYILRPCMIHGPGNKGNLNLLYNIVKRGFPWPLGAFENQRSFVSIANVVFVIRQLIEKNITPGVYNLADDQPVSTNELVCLIADSLGRKARIWKIPKTFIRGLAYGGNVFRLPLNSERLKKLTESYVVSNARLKKALGIRNMPVTAKQGLINSLKHF